MRKDKVEVRPRNGNDRNNRTQALESRNVAPRKGRAALGLALFLMAISIPFPALAQKSDPNLRDLRLPTAIPSRIRGAVYAMTNAANGNQIAVFERDANGLLRAPSYVSTGGLGSGGKPPLEPVDALGSQGGLILSPDQRWLFAVNAGSDDVSIFRVLDRGLVLTDKVASGGHFPNSLTFDGEFLYVLNAGGEANIFGFRVDGKGHLIPLPGSKQSLGVNGLNPPFFLESPAQIGFSSLGDYLLVTVKGTNTIHAFSVGDDGLAMPTPVVNLSVGLTPFGFVFDRRGRLIVIEPFGRAPMVGVAGASAASSYDLAEGGGAFPLTVSVENGQTASCWIAILENGKYVYATNNFSNTITGYRVRRDGALTLLSADGISGHTGSRPVDLAATPDGRFLYNVNAGSGTVSMFAINVEDGSLTPLGEVDGLPVDDGAVGMAAR